MRTACCLDKAIKKLGKLGNALDHGISDANLDTRDLCNGEYNVCLLGRTEEVE